MKSRVHWSQLILLVLAVLCISTSISYGGQVVYGKEAQDGRPTDWESPAQDFQNHLSPTQSGHVQQDPGASGGGEGRPTDWDSPQGFSLFHPLSQIRSLKQFDLPFTSALNLILWWF